MRRVQWSRACPLNGGFCVLRADAPNLSFSAKPLAAATRHLRRSLTQRMSARWHCAARREIAERSEEAPAAEAAQPSRSVGSWKTPAGCFGGDARGAEKGAQPHNRPRLAARRAGGQNNRKEKATVSAGHRSHLSKDKPFFIFLGIYEPDVDMATVQVLLDCLKSYWCS